jgi:hypothetical protein
MGELGQLPAFSTRELTMSQSITTTFIEIACIGTPYVTDGRALLS